MALEGIDLLDLDRFQRLEHWEMFDRLRQEDPVAWHEYPGAQGFWNVVQHQDLVAVNRDTATYSSEVGGISILTPDEYETTAGSDPRGLMMLYTDPPKHTRYRRLVNKGFTPRMIGLIEQYLRAPGHPHRRQHHRARVVRLRHRPRLRAAAPGHRRDHGRAPGGPPAALRLVEPHDRHRRPRVRHRRRQRRHGRAVHVRQRARQAAQGRPARRHRHQAPQRRDRRRQPLRARVRHVHAAADGGRQRDHPQHHRLGHVGPHAEPGPVPGAAQRPRRPSSTTPSRRSCAGPRRCTTSGAPPLADTEIHGQEIKEGDKVVMWHTSADRDETVFDDPYTFDIERANAETTSPSAAAASTSASAPTWPAWSSS